MRRLAPIIASALVAASCGNPADNKISADSQGVAQRTAAVTPPPDGTTPPAGPTVNLDAVEGKSVLDAKYDIKVKAAGFNFCDGSARLLINVPSKDTSSPNAKPLFDVKCISLNCALIGKLVDGQSLNGLLGGAASGTVQPAGNEPSPVKIDEKFIQIVHLGKTTYDPPMVIFPNFAGGSPEFLSRLNETRPMSVIEGATGANGTGTQTLKTVMFKKPYTNPLMPTSKFNDVFQFRLTNDGFAGVDRIKSALLNALEVRINLDPVAVVSMHIETKASDLMALLGQKKIPPPDAAWDPECGPPPAAAPDGGGGLGALLGGAAGGAGGLLGGGGGLIGILANVVTHFITVSGDVVLTEQKGLAEAFAKSKEFDDLQRSQTGGAGP